MQSVALVYFPGTSLDTRRSDDLGLISHLPCVCDTYRWSSRVGGHCHWYSLPRVGLYPLGMVATITLSSRIKYASYGFILVG